MTIFLIETKKNAGIGGRYNQIFSPNPAIGIQIESNRCFVRVFVLFFFLLRGAYEKNALPIYANQPNHIFSIFGAAIFSRFYAGF